MTFRAKVVLKQLSYHRLTLYVPYKGIREGKPFQSFSLKRRLLVVREMSSKERQVPSPLIKGKTLRWERSSPSSYYSPGLGKIII